MLEIIKTKDGWDVCIPVGHGGRLNNTIASFVEYKDAVLFVGAVDLLEACKRALETLEVFEQSGLINRIPLGILQELEHAINKAEEIKDDSNNP